MKTYKLIEHYPIYHIDSEEKWEIVENIFVAKLDLDNPTEEEIINILIDYFIINRVEKDKITIIFQSDVIKVFGEYGRPVATFYSEDNDEWKEKLLRDYTIYHCILNDDGEVIDYDYVDSIKMANPTKEKVLNILGELIPDGCNADVFISDELITVYDEDYKPLFDLVPSAID